MTAEVDMPEPTMRLKLVLLDYRTYLLHYTTLHYTTLHYTTLHYTAWHRTIPHYTVPLERRAPKMARSMNL